MTSTEHEALLELNKSVPAGIYPSPSIPLARSRAKDRSGMSPEALNFNRTRGSPADSGDQGPSAVDSSDAANVSMRGRGSQSPTGRRNQSTIAIKNLHMEQDLVQQKQAAAARAEKAASALPRFKTLLRQKYGTISMSWKQAFDPNGRGTCGFQDYSRVCRAAGFDASAKVWKELDPPNGILSLEDLDAEGFQTLWEFKEMLLEKYVLLREGKVAFAALFKYGFWRACTF